MIFFNGASGGLGRHVAADLHKSGTSHSALATRLEDPQALSDELERVPPLPPGSDVTLIHIAALVSVPECEKRPDLARTVNVDGAVAFVDQFTAWATNRGYRASVVYVSSGHVYAAPEPGRLLVETAALAPRSVYAATKLEAESALTNLSARSHFPLVVARVFGLLAPGQPPHYVLPALIDRARRGDVGAIPGLTNVRDYLDARDVARHLRCLAREATHLESAETAVLNVCSGEETSIGRLLDVIIDELVGSDSVEGRLLHSKVGEMAGRPTDIKWLVGSPAKLVQTLEQPAQLISIPTTVRDAIAAA